MANAVWYCTALVEVERALQHVLRPGRFSIEMVTQSMVRRSAVHSIALIVAFVILSPITFGASAHPPVGVEAEEFHGPFASWADIRRDYGAVGDGKTDNTGAVQRALDDLRERRKSNVLYFPAGIYRITQTVRTRRSAHTDGMGITVVGEDPDTTILRWDGPPGGTLFQYDAWYSKISRLTFDGAGKAGVALAYGDAFSTYNETSDIVCKDAATGLRMGTAEAGQAENAVLRCRFVRCSKAGVETVNFNSMDIWVWRSRFEDCGHALLNEAGNFHAYENLFLRSRVMDIGIHNLMVFSLVNNTSIGSRCFMDWESSFRWGSPCSITGNRISATTGDFAVRLGNAGPYLFAYNTIRSRPGKSGPEVVMAWSDQAFVGNTYTVSNPVKEAGRFRRIDDRVVSHDRVKIVAARWNGAPRRASGRIFDVPVGSDTATIQRILNETVRLRGKRPVVHLPAGIFVIDRTLTIPAGSDLRLVGDGGAENGSILRWAGKPGEPVLLLRGPARMVLRDFSIQAGEGDGIRVTGCDGSGSRILGDQVNVSGGGGGKGEAGLWVNGVTRSTVVMRCLQGGSDLANWVKVTGPAVDGVNKYADRTAVSKPVTVLCGATGTSDGPYLVEKGGRLVVRSVYHEKSGAAARAIYLRDAGSLFIDATRFSYGTTADTPLVTLDGFRGSFALATGLLLPVGSIHPAKVEVIGDGSHTDALVLANCFWQNRAGVTTDMVWSDESKPAANASLLLNNMNINAPQPEDPAKAPDGYGALENRGAAGDAFLRRMLAPLRDASDPNTDPAGVLTRALPTGATLLRMHRILVAVGKGGRGIELRARP